MSDYEHWLARAARSAGLPGATELRIERATPLLDAWEQAAESCGITPDQLAGVVAEHFGLGIADLAEAHKSALRLIPADWAQRRMVLPLGQNDSHIVVAVADPADLLLTEEIGFTSGRVPILVVAAPTTLSHYLEQHYSADDGAEQLLRAVAEPDASVVFAENAHAQEPDIDEDSESAPIVKLTTSILAKAIRKGASDCHIAGTAQGGVVRYRIDGVLSADLTMPMAVTRRVLSRIKVLGGLDIANRLRPQDGRASIEVNGRRFDLRISTVPTRGNEKIVIRILDPMTAKDLDSLGMPPSERQSFADLIAHREGIIFVTGPTGSGKTTTLYALLQHLATEEVNVMTVEDPVEYELAGITQIQVEHAQGVTFASALRACLRQDPDIILVGEIRDLETAEIALQASMTGHLVLATLHTNDAVGAIRRLSDLGIDRPAIAETVVGVVAQRLVRKLCKTCAAAPGAPLTPHEERLRDEFGIEPKTRATGCKECDRLGYRGRTPLLEFFAPDRTTRALIAAGASHGDLTEAAIAAGMRSLMDSGLQRVATGVTTLEEVLRVLGDDGEQSHGTCSDDVPNVALVPERASESVPALDPEASVRIQEPSPQSRHASGRILLVDDSRVDRTIAKTLLVGAGFVVEEADNGLAAISLLAARPGFDAVVTDLDMPELGGRELLRYLRSSDQHAGLPVIVQTGTSDLENEAALIEQGADDYVRKPLVPARFLARVRAALRRAGYMTHEDTARAAAG